MEEEEPAAARRPRFWWRAGEDATRIECRYSDDVAADGIVTEEGDANTDDEDDVAAVVATGGAEADDDEEDETASSSSNLGIRTAVANDSCRCMEDASVGGDGIFFIWSFAALRNQESGDVWLSPKASF